MKKIKMIQFATVISRIKDNMTDLASYNIAQEELKYIEVFYDGTDFIVVNTKTDRKVYVAKTNVSQWELDDTDGKKNPKGVSKEK